MTPTLQPGDGLQVLPCPREEIRVGDVIVFSRHATDFLIIHRVVAIEPDGLRTRGDNNNKIDKDLVLWEDILGKAVSAHRKTETRRLANGPVGAALHAWIRIYKPLRKVAFRAVCPVYQWMARTSIARHYRSKLPPVEVYRYRRAGGVELHLYQGGKYLGRRLAHSNEWKLRRGHRFLVDLSALSLDQEAGPEDKHPMDASQRLENKT